MSENGMSPCVILISSLLVFQMNVNGATGKRKINKSHNNIIDVKADCSLTSLNVTLTLEQEFQGVVYAHGFPLECRALGSRETSVTLHLVASGCGVRITPSQEGGLLYSVIVEIQMAKHLQQVSDPIVPVSCLLTEDKMVLHSHALSVEKPKTRGGRMMQRELEPQPKAWLEIQGSTDNTVSVGEPTSILVKTWLPVNVSGRVVDCVAHDGLGESSQALVDTAGCAVDETLVPQLRQAWQLSRDSGDYRFTVHTTSFPAFKFPDRESVHIRCGLQLCRGACQQVDCSSEFRPRNRHQRKLKGEEGEILDYIQVFNSVEVMAPGIDMGSSQPNRLNPSDIGEGGYCLAAPRMALALATAGLVSLAAVAVALCVLLRRYLRTHVSSPDSLSRSSLSVSAWSYGRI